MVGGRRREVVSKRSPIGRRCRPFAVSTERRPFADDTGAGRP